MATPDQPISRQRIAFVQHGNFLVDAERLRAGGPETYFAQRSSVEMVERLTQQHAGVMVVCLGHGPFEQELCTGIRTIGIPEPSYSPSARRQLRASLDAWRPTTVIIRTTMLSLIEHCLSSGWRVLPLFADSFNGSSLKTRFNNWRLARVLNRGEIDIIANHQVPASRDLVRIGVNPAKVVPWDWESSSTPADFPVKAGVRSRDQISVMYAGAISEPKGVGDLLAAVADLHRSGTEFRLTVAGIGEIDQFRDRAAQLGVADRVNFTGLVPHSEIAPMMHEHDVVVVPSRHSYPEGLPMTIYDALISRTPLVVSDHPMFVKRIEHERNALVFHEAESAALANCLRRLLADDELYSRLSESSAEFWHRLRIPVLWNELVERWLSVRPEDRQWLLERSLARHNYD